MPKPPYRRSMLQRPGRVGLIYRAIALLLLEGLALGVVMFLQLLEACFTDVRTVKVALIFAGITLTMLLGLIFTELPSGDEHTFTRLGLATFCRTGLPLLVVIAIWKYSVWQFRTEAIFLAVVFYAVGHFGGMVLSTLPLRTPTI